MKPILLPLLAALVTGCLLAPPALASSPSAALLPGGKLPDGQRVQATFLAADPQRSFVLLSHPGGNRQARPGTDIGEGLVLDQVMADRIILLRQQQRYYLPLQAVPAGQRMQQARTQRPPGMPGSFQPGSTTADNTAHGGNDISASSIQQLSSQCGSAEMAALSAERRDEIRALGICR